MNASEFNLVPSPKDPRDYLLLFSSRSGSRAVDLRSRMPPVYRQDGLQSCTAQATGAAVHFSSRSATPSRLFLWYNTRSVRGDMVNNVGCTIRDAVHSVVKQGVCREELWPYVRDMFDDKPSELCYAEAANWKMELYARVNQEVSQVEGALLSDLPVIFGMKTHKSFSDAGGTGLVKVPDPPNDPHMGGHAMLIVGADPVRRVFIVRNSWGDTWGDKGHCYIPYELMMNTSYVFDLWVVKDLDSMVPSPHTIVAPVSSTLIRSWSTAVDSFSSADGRPRSGAVTWFDVQLPFEILSYKIVPRGGFPAEYPGVWRVLGSDDAKSWKLLDTQSRASWGDLSFPLRTQANWIRFEALGSSRNAGGRYGRRVSLSAFSVTRKQEET